MKTIFKYTLDGGLNVVAAPEDAHWRHVADQHDDLAIWAEVDTSLTVLEHRIWVIGTGHRMPDLPLEYIGTAVCDGGNYVFHAYKEIL